MKRTELVQYLDETLNLAAFASDVSNNGLQAEGSEDVDRIIAGVDACMPLYRKAQQKGGSMILVHHGISWGSEPRRFTGCVASQLKFLLGNNLNLYAAHLPLDAHPVLGNNAELCRLAGIAEKIPCCNYRGVNIGFAGKLREPVTLGGLAMRFGVPPAACFGDAGQTVRTAAAGSGGGGLEALHDAAERGADVLITGEFTHEMFHFAEESGVKVIALGHYASEVWGVRALLADLRRKFGLEGSFVDIPTGL